MASTGQKNLYILSFTLVVITLGFGMVMPIFPFMITNMGGSGDEYGLLIALAAFTQLIFSPFWGNISDRIGRKPVLLIGMVGTGLTLVIFGIATRLWMLFVGRALSGLLASAVMPAAMAYIGDSTSEEERGGGIGKLGGAAAIGIILGPGVGGLLAGDSLTLPFFIAAGFTLLSCIFILGMLPESHNTATINPENIKMKIIDLGELWRALNGPIGILLVMAFIVSFGATNFQAIFGLYAMQKFDFNAQQVGVILMVVGLVSAIIQGTFTGPLTKRFGEIPIIKVSFLTNALGFLVLLLANSYATVLLTTGVYILSHTLLRPAVQSLTSRKAAMGQGMAMGMNNAFISLGQIAGPIWAGYVFDINVNFPYLSGAVILLAGFVVSVVKMRQNQMITIQAETREAK